MAVIGLGAMGSRIAARLADAGHDLVVWNRDPAKAAPLTARGARLAASPGGAAGGVDVVLTMVSDPRALRDVTEGESGVAAGARPSTTLVQMSTVGPADVARLASILPDGVELLDAPVLGSLAEVESGNLRIFAGGAPDVIDRRTPLLSTLGTVVHTGALGTGTAAKLVANSTLFGVLAALGEALALAGGLGLPRDVAFEVLGATPLAEQAGRRRPSIESGDYPPRFALSLARKDADLILEAAEASSVDVPVAAAARAWLARAEEAGAGARDYSAVLAEIVPRRADRAAD